MEHSFVNPILESPVTWLVARILATFMFWYAGLGFLLDFPGAVATMQAEGFTTSPAFVAALTLAVQLTGSALVIHGRYAWFGAGMLAVFTLATIPMVHDWWNMTGTDAIQAKLESEEHLTVIGGLIAVSILSHLTRRKAHFP